MKVRKLRSIIAGAALSLAVLTSATAAAWQTLPWARADAGGAAAVEAGETATEFLLTDRNGEVCVYAGETLISSTGHPRPLPAPAGPGGPGKGHPRPGREGTCGAAGGLWSLMQP